MNEKLIFSYEELAPTFDELYNFMKFNSMNRKWYLKWYLKMVLLFTIIYIFILLVFNQTNKLTIFHLFPIILIQIILLFYIKIVSKKLIYKLSNMSNTKFYFYNDYIILDKNNKLEYIFYNEINNISENKAFFNFYQNENLFILKKEKLEQNQIDFINELKDKISNKQKYNEYNYYQNFIQKNTSNLKLLSDIIIDKSIIKKYYKIKKVVFKIYVKNLIYLFIFTILLIFINKLFNNKILYTDKEGIYIMLTTLLLFSPLFIRKMIKIDSKENFNKCSQCSFFYEHFMLVKINEQIYKYEYKDILQIIEKDNLTFFKFKNSIQPIIVIDKSNLSIVELNFLNNIKMHTTLK